MGYVVLTLGYSLEYQGLDAFAMSSICGRSGEAGAWVAGLSSWRSRPALNWVSVRCISRSKEARTRRWLFTGASALSTMGES